MRFLFEVFFLCMILLAVILAVSWVYEKYWPKPIPVIFYPPISSDLQYQNYETDYEQIAAFVWRCLCESKCKYIVNTSSDVKSIYCDEIVNRVKEVEPGIFTVKYEVCCQPQNGLPRVNASNGYAKQLTLIEDVLKRNLPSYFRAGYHFMGPINVLDITHNRIRIEIHGVYRIPQCYGDEIWYQSEMY